MSSKNLAVHSTSSLFLDRDLLTNFTKGNNTFEYDFGRTVWTTDDTKMSLSNFSVPFSWYNISKSLENNIFGYTWYDSQTSGNSYGGVQYPASPAAITNQGNFYAVTIPDGYYDIPAFNAFLQYTMIKNGHYMIDSNNNYVYFLEIVQNPTTFRVQVNSYQLPSNGVPVGWSAGANTHVAIPGAVAVPKDQPYPTPQLLLFQTNQTTGSLFSYFGFTRINLVPGWTVPSDSIVGTSIPSAFPAMGSNVGLATPTSPTQYNIQALFPPLISQVHSICLTCSVIDNPLRATEEHAVSTRVLTTQSITVPYGEKISNTNFFTTWIPLLQNANISKLVFQLTDQEGDLLILEDADINIELLITNLKY